MTTLIPTASICHTLQLPPIEKDDRLNLNVRTGSAATLYNSLVFSHGGLTIGLELQDHTLPELLNIFKLRINNLKSLEIENYISGELFYLKLIERTWFRVIVPPKSPKPAPRLLHEICAINNCVYIFGGLRATREFDYATNAYKNDQIEDVDSLVPCNDLWEFNLEKREWTLLHDGTGWETNEIIPKPRFLHKMTAILSITFIRKNGHFGIFIAGGKDSNSEPIYDNVIFDLVDKKYVCEGHEENKPVNLHLGKAENLKAFDSVNENGCLNINYTNSIIVNVTEEIDHIYMKKKIANTNTGIGDRIADEKELLSEARNTTREESIMVYAPVNMDVDHKSITNPLISFKVGKKLRLGKVVRTHRQKKDTKSSQTKNHTMPFNLRYPTGGLFGKNLVIVGFLPGDFDISIFVFNKPTGRWSRLNIFCNHDYGTHRFWGGFAWQSHHKVVLLGNYLTLKTTSSIRFFSLMITVSLPITNIVASFELAGNEDKRQRMRHKLNNFKDEGSNTDSSANGDNITRKTTTSTSSDSDSVEIRTKSSEEFALFELEDEEDEEEGYEEEEGDLEDGEVKSPTISFNDYVHYAAPKTNFTTIRSVFPPAAVTLGRIALDRYGDLISDFELISSNGDRIPVSLNVLMERWGRYFIDLLARGYVQAVEKFENSQIEDANALRMSKDSGHSSTSSASRRLKTSLQSALEVESNKSHSNTPSHNKSHSFHMSIPVPKQKSPEKDAPQFRLPFQDSTAASSSTLLNLEKADLEVTSPGQVINDEFKSRSDVIDGLAGEPEDLADSGPLEERPTTSRVSSAIDPHSSLNFQEGSNTGAYASSNTNDNSKIASTSSTPLQSIRRESTSSFASANSLFISHLQDIPPQLPLPDEPTPAVPVTTSFRSSSRKLSSDISSPRASLIHTLTVLRNIPTSRSPRESPFASPRNSFSGPQMMIGGQDLTSTGIPNLKHKDDPSQSLSLTLASPSNKFSHLKSAFSMADLGNGQNSKRLEKDLAGSSGDSLSSSGSSKKSSDFKYSEFNKQRRLTEEQQGKEDADENEVSGLDSTSVFDGLLNLDDMESGKFRMEPSLIPRKLYIPFSTISVKGFCEFLYTGQVGNKWLLSPTTLDNLALSKFYKAPLLYDLISEVLFGVIGRKESYVINEGKKLKSKYFELIKLTNTPLESDFKFPLDEYDGLMDTVDDGYLDIALLKKASEHRKNSSMSSGTRKKSRTSTIGFKKRHSKLLEMPTLLKNSEGANTAPDIETDTELSSNDSLKQISSTSDDDNDFELAYLDSHGESANLGPRSKSIFDKAHGKLSFQSKVLDSDNELDEDDDLAEEKLKVSTLTLEQLVSPNAPIPSDYVIDLIYEMGAITSDMKLMLRSINAKHMSKILSQWKDELEETIEHLQAKYELQCRDLEREKSHNAQAERIFSSNQAHKNDLLAGSLADSSALASPNSGAVSETPYRSTAPSLKPSRSTTSLLSTGSIRTEGTEKSSRGFPRIAGFTPFTSGKGKVLTAMENNKEVDKRITKLIKKDEKLRMKHEKDEKLRLAQQHNLDKQKKKQDEKLHHGKIQHSPTLPNIGGHFTHTPITRTNTSDSSNTTSSAGKKGHGLLYNFNHPLTRKHTASAIDLKMTKTGGSASDTNSIDSGKSIKSFKSTTKHGLFGLKHKSKESSPSSVDNAGVPLDRAPLHILKSFTSLHSQDSKKSQNTTTSSGSSGKKRLHIFGSKKEK